MKYHLEKLLNTYTPNAASSTRYIQIFTINPCAYTCEFFGIPERNFFSEFQDQVSQITIENSMLICVTWFWNSMDKSMVILEKQNYSQVTQIFYNQVTQITMEFSMECSPSVHNETISQKAVEKGPFWSWSACDDTLWLHSSVVCEIISKIFVVYKNSLQVFKNSLQVFTESTL